MSESAESGYSKDAWLAYWGRRQKEQPVGSVNSRSSFPDDGSADSSKRGPFKDGSLAEFFQPHDVLM